ncbi:MAG: J domain-containing protein [Burkholderiales bacterium]
MGEYLKTVSNYLFLILVIGGTLTSVVIPLTLTSLPAWGAGLAVGFCVLSVLRLQRLRSLRSPQTLAKLTTLHFDGKKLNCSLNYSEVEKYENSESAVRFAAIACAATTVGVLFFLEATGAFRGYAFRIWDIGGEVATEKRLPELASLIIAGIISAIAIRYFFNKTNPSRLFKSSVRREIEQCISSANLSFKATGPLQAIIKEITVLSTKLGIDFTENSLAPIHNYIRSHQAELLVSTIGLDRLLKAELARARGDRSRLEKAFNLYENAMSVYTDVSRYVNKTGSMPLIKEMEYDYAGLAHSDLKPLLSQRRWTEFHDVVNSIIEDLQRLKDLAVKYELHEEEYEEFEVSSVAETDEEKAYRVLGVPPAITNEDIKRIWKNLNRAYHPDSAREEDRKFFDDKLKDINWAYDILKAARNIS